MRLSSIHRVRASPAFAGILPYICSIFNVQLPFMQCQQGEGQKHPHYISTRLRPSNSRHSPSFNSAASSASRRRRLQSSVFGKASSGKEPYQMRASSIIAKRVGPSSNQVASMPASLSRAAAAASLESDRSLAARLPHRASHLQTLSRASRSAGRSFFTAASLA